MLKNILLILIVCFSLFSCGEESLVVPKPRAYPRINFPEKEYQAFDKDYCQFTFEYPAYAKIVQDTSFFDELPVDPCWFDIYYPDFDGRIHCSYRPIDKENPLEKLKQEAFKMANWHNKRANYIEEILIQKPNKVSGFAFDMKGPTASPFQFYLTDSTTHFFRASLYFNTQVQPDSLAPVYEFVKGDILKMIETFEWN